MARQGEEDLNTAQSKVPCSGNERDGGKNEECRFDAI